MPWCSGVGSWETADQPGMPQVGTQGLAECKSEIVYLVGKG